MHSHRAPGTNVVMDFYRFGGINMHGTHEPTGCIGTNGYDRQVNIRKSFAYGFELNIVVAGIAPIPGV